MTHRDGRQVVTPPVVCYDDRALAELGEFARTVTTSWSLREAKRKTPREFTPAGLAGSAYEPPAQALAVASRYHMEPPALQLEMARRPVPYRPTASVIDRWWRRREAKQHRIDLAGQLRRARKAHRLLRALGGVARRGVSCAVLGMPELAPGVRVSDAWHDLQSAVRKLVAFRRAYLAAPFAAFAVRLAVCAEDGEKFFSRLAKAIASKGVAARADRFDGERWELCVRVAEHFGRESGLPYRRLRGLISTVILNYEFLKTQRRSTPESVRKWLFRNGW